MSSKTEPIMRLDQPPRPRAARTSVAIIATAALVLLATACGGSPSSNGSGSPNAGGSANSRLVAFSHCMRSNGVSNYPDPNSNGQIPKESVAQLGVTSSQFQAAQSACQHLHPTASVAQQRHVAAQALLFSRCMRNHGVTNFPDPANDGRLPDPATLGIDQGSPEFEAANRACGEYRPPYMPSNAAYNAYAGIHGS
jgi:hypothetical protein